jgi:serine/threonine protein kinase
MQLQQDSAEKRYVPITTLGRGGMGEVVLASRPDAGPRALAVTKRIWPELADEPDFIAMFMDEAHLALRLHHRNIVQTFEVGQDAGPEVDPDSGVLVAERGRYFLAMEYLAGQPLSHILRRLRGSDSFSLQLRLQIVIEVLRALEYAHDLRADDGRPLGIVHRDISPDNIFITYDGEVKLMDFGVAKSLFASHHTRPGVFKGRFTYAAPEQLRGLNVDRRADLFAMGVILWELLTDRRMFRGRTEAEVARTLNGHDPLPPLPEEWPIPPELRKISARALSLEPRGRYPNATKFRRDLADVLALGLPRENRPLGGVVARAFRAEKQSMEWLIERHFHGAEPWRSAGRPTRLGREERPREASSPGSLSAVKKVPLIWSSFEVAGGHLAPAAVQPTLQPSWESGRSRPSVTMRSPDHQRARSDRETPPAAMSGPMPPPLPPRRPRHEPRITESAPAVEIGDDTRLDRPLPLRGRSLTWPQFAVGTGAVLATIFSVGWLTRPADGGESERRPVLAAMTPGMPGPSIEPLTVPGVVAPVAMPATAVAPGPVAAPAVAPTPAAAIAGAAATAAAAPAVAVAAPTAPVAALAPRPRRRLDPNAAADRSFDEILAETAAATERARLVSPATPTPAVAGGINGPAGRLTAEVSMRAPTLDTQNPYGP